MMEIKGPPAELHFTLEITRKETGLVETYQLVGIGTYEDETDNKEIEHGSNTLNDSTNSSN